MLWYGRCWAQDPGRVHIGGVARDGAASVRHLRHAQHHLRHVSRKTLAEAWRCVVRYLWGGRISHRPALLAYHDTLLAIGDGKCGFTLSTIERSVHAAAVGKLTAASVVDKDTENSIKAHLTQRSAGYDKMAKLRALPERSNRARFARLWQLGRPDNLAKKLGGMCVFFACQIWLMEFKNYNEVRRLSTPLTAIRPLCESSLRRLTAVAATASHSALA